MRTELLLLTTALLLAAPATQIHAASGVYKTVDADGNVIFTDNPKRTGTTVVEQVELPEDNTYEAPASEFQTYRLTPPEADAGPQLPTSYSLTLLSPADGETLRSNPGTVTVTGQTNPGVPSPHRLQILLGGTVAATLDPEQATSTFSATLDAVDRGEHQLQLRVVDDQGKTVATSAPRTFFLQRISLLSPSRRGN